MLKHRVIPSLLISDEGLVKTKQFKDQRYIGDPINAIKIFNEKEVDELIVLDINASRLGLEPNYQLIEKFAGECFMPLTYGGGVKTIEQASRLFACGIEKICFQTSVLKNPEFVSQLANRFGSQSVIVSVDIKLDWLGNPRVYSYVNAKVIKDPWIEIILSLVEAGAGEVLLNSVDNDGTLSGPDFNLVRELSTKVEVPLVYAGGVSSLEDIKLLTMAGASGVAVGAFFVYYGRHQAVLITYPKYSELEALFEY